MSLGLRTIDKPDVSLTLTTIMALGLTRFVNARCVWVVVGLRPRVDDTVEVYSLLPNGTWDRFCLDGVRYHGHTLTILWDKQGKRYGRVKGLSVLADGNVIARCDKLGRLTGKLP